MHQSLSVHGWTENAGMAIVENDNRSHSKQTLTD